MTKNEGWHSVTEKWQKNSLSQVFLGHYERGVAHFWTIDFSIYNMVLLNHESSGLKYGNIGRNARYFDV